MSVMIARRSFLGMMATCPLCAQAIAAEAEPPQSPIDLSTSVPAGGGTSFRIAYSGSQDLNIRRYGYTFEVYPIKTNTNTIMLGVNEVFKLDSFHFHHPAEHIVKDGRYPMECHFVNKRPGPGGKDLVAVAGVFIKAGFANSALTRIWEVMPPSKEGNDIAGVNLNLLLRPTGSVVTRYDGSLTGAPFPSPQPVIWTVYQEPVEASPEQIAKFQRTYPPNARSVQPRDGRPVLNLKSS